jgi:hypothetical protein
MINLIIYSILTTYETTIFALWVSAKDNKTILILGFYALLTAAVVWQTFGQMLRVHSPHQSTVMRVKKTS